MDTELDKYTTHFMFKLVLTSIMLSPVYSISALALRTIQLVNLQVGWFTEPVR